MVFGWGKKKEKNPETESIPLEKQISLSEVNKIINDIKSLRHKTVVSESKSFKNRIDDELKKLLKITKELEKDRLNIDDIDKNLRTIVVRGKNQVISTILKDASFTFTKISSYDDVIQYDKEISQTLKKIGDVLGRQTRVIHIFAKKYAEKLKTILSTLDSDAKELHMILDNYKKLENNMILISNNLTEINQNSDEQQGRKKRLIDFNKEYKEFDEKIKSLLKYIDRLKSSKEYIKFQQIKNSLDNLESERAQIQDEIDQQFTKISRPLTKYDYVSSLEKPQKVLMEKLLQNPFGVLVQENKNDIIIILQSARKGIQSGSVSVKDMDKSIFYIDETTELLENFMNKISKFNLKKTNLEKELEIFNINELERKYHELSKIKNDKEDLENKIQTFEKEISYSETKIPALIKDTEEILRKISSTKYVINQ